MICLAIKGVKEVVRSWGEGSGRDHPHRSDAGVCNRAKICDSACDAASARVAKWQTQGT